MLEQISLITLIFLKLTIYRSFAFITDLNRVLVNILVGHTEHLHEKWQVSKGVLSTSDTYQYEHSNPQAATF